MRLPWSKKPEYVGDNDDLSNVSEGIIDAASDIKSADSESMSQYDFPDLSVGDYVDYSQFSKFRELSSDRKVQYSAYDEMTKDIIISSALEMYADDASQYDTKGRLIWADSSDTELANYINDLLELLNISKNLWSMYYSLAEYGDVYIRLFKRPKESTGAVDRSNGMIDKNESLTEQLIDKDVDYEDFVEVCDDPENIFELIKNGKTCQYAVMNYEAGRRKQERVELYPPDQFVHIYINNPHIRDKQMFEFRTIDRETHKEKLHRYKVRRGKSMLYDIYAVEKEIQLLENALLLNRISKSAVTRVVSVEVGDMPKPDVRQLTRRVKNSLESKLSITKTTGSIKSYTQPGGLDNILVNPTRNGKGSITVNNVGGDVDIKSLLDLDYFNDKRFGGLKIPKAFLGYDEALGANSGGTLTKMDARYGRTIKRLQTCVVAGITDLVNLYLLHRGMEDKIGEFTIKVVSPSTVEDSERDEQLQSRLNIIATIMQTVAELPGVDQQQVLSQLLTTYLNDPNVSEVINNKSEGSKSSGTSTTTSEPVRKPRSANDLLGL